MCLCYFLTVICPAGPTNNYPHGSTLLKLPPTVTPHSVALMNRHRSRYDWMTKLCSRYCPFSLTQPSAPLLHPSTSANSLDLVIQVHLQGFRWQINIRNFYPGTSISCDFTSDIVVTRRRWFVKRYTAYATNLISTWSNKGATLKVCAVILYY